jgi:hypothetical protein
MRLFASSLIEGAKTWIDSYPKGGIKTPEELERAFKIRWCNHEHTQPLYSQYIDICKGSSEGIRDFNDRFNLLLKKVRPNLNSEEAILQTLLELIGRNFAVYPQGSITLNPRRSTRFRLPD